MSFSFGRPGLAFAYRFGVKAMTFDAVLAADFAFAFALRLRRDDAIHAAYDGRGKESNTVRGID